MPFSSVFNAGMSIYNAGQARKAADSAAKMARYQADVAEVARKDANAQALFNSQMGAKMLDRQDEQNEFRMQAYQDQNAMERELQRYLRANDARNEQRLQDEIARITGRQELADSVAQENREFELERIARDDRLTQQERQFALAELQRERDRARRQRQQEQGILDEARSTARSEYNDRMARLMEDRMMRQQERQMELDRSNQVIADAAATRDRLRGVLDQYGTLTAPELVGQDEIDRRSARYYDQFSQEVQRGLDRNLSQLEADLIRRGMQDGGSSNAQRAEILARVAPQFMRAQMEANQAAAGDVGAMNKVRQDRFANLRQALQTQLDAEQQVGMTGQDLAAQLSRGQTSGILDRDIGSATNNYALRGPETSMYGIGDVNDIVSQVRNVSTPGSGIGASLSMPGTSLSASTSSGYASLPSLSGYDAQNYFNQATNAINTNATNAQNMSDTAYDRAATAATNYGKALNDATKAFGSNIDEAIKYGKSFF